MRPTLLGFILVLGLVVGCGSDRNEASPGTDSYVGRDVCAGCHPNEARAYAGSDHDLAMDAASSSTVLGDFDDARFEHLGVTSRFYVRDGRYFVSTEGPDGKPGEFEIKYTFGVRPLQQYLVEFPGGRIQCLPLCWDTRPAELGGQRWFHIYDDERIAPDDILYWTRTTQTWNYMCAECHSTNLRKNYDAAARRYRTTWFEIDVSCEACHGPGRRHAAWAETRKRGDVSDYGNGLAIQLSDSTPWVVDSTTATRKPTHSHRNRQQIELCARCHSRRSIINEDYVHGDPLLDTHYPRTLDEGLYRADGQILDEVYVYASFLQSTMYAAGVSCTDCHDPHSGKVRGEGDLVCLQCHNGSRYAQPTHHHHREASAGARCIGCHMPKRTYMVVDDRYDHSFRVPRPDLTEKIGVPNACNACHDDRSARWATEHVMVWRDGRTLPTHYGEVFAAAREGQPAARDALVELAQQSDRPAIVRATAVSLLDRYPVGRAFEALRSALSDPSPLVRASAVDALDAWPLDERFAVVVPLLRDSVRVVRAQAGRSLAGAAPGAFTDTDRGHFDDALREYEAAQMVNADHPTAWMNLGLLYHDMGDAEQAEAAYRRAITLEPVFMAAYVNLSDLYREQDRDAAGVRVLEDALAKNDRAAAVHHSLGLALVRSAERERALEHLATAVELEPDNARFGYVYAVGLSSSGEPERALEVLRAASENNPYDRDLLFMLATVHADTGDYSAALTYAERLLDCEPQNPEVRQLERTLRSLVESER